MRRFFLGLAIIAMLGIVPSKARGNDRQIARQIVGIMQEHKQTGDLSDFNIELEVENGSVYLKGRVANKEQEKLAVDIAREAEGVREVFNEIEIMPGKDDSVQLASAHGNVRPASRSLSQQPTPAMESGNADSRELAERIYARLREEKDKGRLKGFSLDLEVIDGIATLTGSVASPAQRDIVLDVVRRVPGVKQVVNGLAVAEASRASAAPARKSTEDIASTVIDQLESKKESGELRDFGVDVEVDEGIVWLTGYVANEQQRHLVLDTARYVPGVSKVVNDIEIKSTNDSAKRATPVSDRRVSRRPPTPPQEMNEEAFNAPRPLASHDAPIGSSVADDMDIPQMSVPAPRLAQRSAPPAPAHATQTQSLSSGSQRNAQYWAPGSPSGNSAGGAQTPSAFAPARAANHSTPVMESGGNGEPVPINSMAAGVGIAPARFDHPQLPQYAWPSYAAYPNYGAVTYPRQYSATAWPYIGPFYPYPQVPLGWRKATLEWKDGWWQLDFKSRHH